LRQLPDVRDFERRFTSVLREAAAGIVPFGVMRPISCYDTGPGRQRPMRQASTGNIWRLEPAKVVTSLVSAVVPRLRRELDAARAAEEKVQKEKDRRAQEEADARLASERLRRWQIAAGIGFLALVIALLAIFAISNANRDKQKADALALQQAASAIRSRPVQSMNVAAVNRVLDDGTVDDSDVVRAAFDGLQQAILATGEQLDRDPDVTGVYADDIARWSDAVETLRAPARQAATALRRRLDERQLFVRQWVTAPPPADDWGRRWEFLRTEAARFGKTDARFSEHLASVASHEKRAAVDHWQQNAPSDTTVLNEINRIHGLLQHARMVLDDEYSLMARNVGATSLVRTILTTRDNRALIDAVIRPLASDLAATPQQQLQFRELSGRAFGCAESFSCRTRLFRVNAALEAITREADSVAGAMQNLWASLLPGSRAERLALWAAVADTLTKTYYFDTTPGAWPGSVEPLSAQVNRLLARAEGTSWDPSNELRARLSRPLYCDEMLYLRRGLAARDDDPPSVSSRLRFALGQCRPLPTAP
jgi:hypothetical protein